MPTKKISRLQKFELDIRALERAILPFVVLSEIKRHSPEGLSGLRLKDKVVERLERVYPSEELHELIFPAGGAPKIYDFHISVLYPMLEYFAELGFIKRTETSPYVILPEGVKMIETWKNAIEKINEITGATDVIQ